MSLLVLDHTPLVHTDLQGSHHFENRPFSPILVQTSINKQLPQEDNTEEKWLKIYSESQKITSPKTYSVFLIAIATQAGKDKADLLQALPSIGFCRKCF